MSAKLRKNAILGHRSCKDSLGSKEVDDVAFEVDCAMVTIKEGAVDIGM